MSALPIFARLLLSYLLVTVLPLAGLAALYLASFEASLKQTVLASVATLADKKADQIESYMAERLADARLLAQQESIRGGIATLGDAFRSGGTDSAAYGAAAERLRHELESSGSASHFHDLLLLDAAGNVVFSLTRKSRPGANLAGGPERDTELAKSFGLAMQTLRTRFSRFARYAPSGEQPAAFVVAPVVVDGRATGALALQLDVDRLLRVASDRTGLGHTGETVLAQKEGGDAFYTAPLRHVAGAAYRYRVPLARTAPPMQHALAGEHGRGIVRDYAGIACVAAWRYVPSLDWGMVVKIDADEALAPVVRLHRLAYLALALFLLLSGGVAYVLGRRLSRPVEALTRVAERIADGDLEPRAAVGDRGELGRLARAFNHMADALASSRQNLEAQVEARSKELRALTTLQNAILAQAGALVLVLDREGRIRRFNRACEELTQYAFAEVEGKFVWDLFLAPEERDVVHAEAFRALVQNPEALRGTYINHWVARDGTRRLIEWSNALLRDARGEVEFLVALGVDVTEKKRAEAALKESERRLNEAQRIAQVGSWELDIASGRLTWSDEIFRIFEIDPTVFDASYDAFLETVHPDDRERVDRAYTESLENRTPYEIVHRLRMPDGRVKWVNERCETHYGEDGTPLRSTGTVQDITERREAEDRISQLAYHDALTGLLNRVSLQGQLEHALAVARREHRPLAVVFLDLDRFKTINDTMGHAVGDQLLVEVAQRVRGNVRDSDIVARLGGDEFVVVLTEVDDATAAARVADKILHAVAQRYRVGERELRSTASLGIALYPDDGEDGGALMKNADTAMYHAKALGRNNVQFFTAEMNQAAVKRLMLEHELQVAVENRQLALCYQPQLDRDGRIVAVEALVRWRHPREGLLLPEEFIPAAEEAGLILALGDWVMNEACRQLRAWREQGIENLGMAVNLSAHQLHSPQLLVQVARALEEYGLSGEELELEITESVAMHDPDASISQIRALRALGVRLSIDDFGTGYSSLSHLKLLPIHTLKLDKSFVRDIERDSNNVAICTATIALAHSLGLEVIAEGVETEAQREFLVAHACDFMQGYLFSGPLPPEAVPSFILRQRAA